MISYFILQLNKTAKSKNPKSQKENHNKRQIQRKNKE